MRVLFVYLCILSAQRRPGVAMAYPPPPPPLLLLLLMDTDTIHIVVLPARRRTHWRTHARKQMLTIGIGRISRGDSADRVMLILSAVRSDKGVWHRGEEELYLSACCFNEQKLSLTTIDRWYA
jgi:hypothetical protein